MVLQAMYGFLIAQSLAVTSAWGTMAQTIMMMAHTLGFLYSVYNRSEKLYALWEQDGAYVDSLGIAAPSYSFSTGRASAGIRVSYPLESSSTTTLAPYAGVYGDYYLAGTHAAVAGVPTIPMLLQGWSARVATGLDMRFGNGGTIGFGGEYGGIGSHTSVLTYRIRGSLPF